MSISDSRVAWLASPPMGGRAHPLALITLAQAYMLIYHGGAHACGLQLERFVINNFSSLFPLTQRMAPLTHHTQNLFVPERCIF